MARSAMAGWEERFDDYVERLGDVLGHADRRAPLRAYTPGLLPPRARKSVAPMAARVGPGRVGAAHQSLHHFVAKAAWDDAALLAAVRAHALPARHRQVKLEGDGEAPRLARAANLWGGFGASDLGPHRERLRADGSVLGGRKVIAVEVEEVVDLVVRREEPLRLAG